MKKINGKNSMTLEELASYLDDLIRMGFVSEHFDEDGKKYHKLTDMGKRSGLEELPK